LAKNGGIDFDTQVRKGTDGDWVSAASIKGLFPDEPYVPPQVSTEPPEFAPSAEIHKMPIAPQKPVEPSRNAVDRNLPSSVELLSFNLVRIAMMLFACLAILAAFWFLILLLLNLRPTLSNPADPSIYSTIKARSRADMAEPNTAADQKGDAIQFDETEVIVRGLPFGVPKRLRGVLDSNDADYINKVYGVFDRKHLRIKYDPRYVFEQEIVE
jgi:hypothetical protein